MPAMLATSPVPAHASAKPRNTMQPNVRRATLDNDDAPRGLHEELTATATDPDDAEVAAMNSKDRGHPSLRYRGTMEPSLKLGVGLCELARYSEAESILTRCLEDARRSPEICERGEDSKLGHGADEGLYVRALTALAALYQAQSRYDAAIELHEEAVPIARSLLSPRSSPSGLDLAENIAGYAETLRKSGDLRAAERHHREALAIRKGVWTRGGCSEVELAVSYTQLGCTLAGLGRDSEAYDQHRLALTLRYRYLDFSHGLVSESMNYCAECLRILGRAREGIPLALHAVSIRRRTFGASHPAHAHALSVLASCYHAIGRHLDASQCLETCLEICEKAFRKDHANMIPNLMSYGDVLRSTGDLERAREAYERAIRIHGLNFKDGQRAGQREECECRVSSLAAEMEEQESSLPSLVPCSPRSSLTSIATSASSADQDVPHRIPAPFESKGTPVIVFTDIGRDADDEMAAVLLSALRRRGLLDPLAVVATLSPARDRARLARGSLDALGMADVPVGIGGRGGLAAGVDLEVYDAEHARDSPSVWDDGIALARRALEGVPDGSARVVCLASLSDMATLMEDHRELFKSKVREVVIMGGVQSLDAGDVLKPDTAYNNNCDMAAAEYVYRTCQELGVPTATLSRWAAYGCPVRPRLMDELAKTRHVVAANIRSKSKQGIDELWNKVVHPPGHPKREKLPARCDVPWFRKTFCGQDHRASAGGRPHPASVWSEVEKLNMYDPLAVLICVPAFRETHFKCRTKTVGGVNHVVVGTAADETGIRDAVALYREYSGLFVEALRRSLRQPEGEALGGEKEPDVLLEETARILVRRGGRARAHSAD